MNAAKEIRTVGVVGAGRMGMPIIGHLARKGFTVLVHDLNPAKKAPVVERGATWSNGIAGLAAGSDAVLVCVGFDNELRALISGRGMLPHVRPGTIVALLSTVKPDTVQELADIAARAQVAMVDATVCRGGRAADTGTLLSFVGGDEAVFHRLEPVLAAYSTDIVHTGKVGSAQVAKAANNLILWACVVADHEALALADRYGLDVNMLREALMKSSANNDVLKHWGTNEMEWAQDDLAIIAAMAQERGISLPQTGLTREICRSLKPRRYKLDEYGC
ncbi:MAG: NAD(P)-dependent oxidoreductase [Telluria sp.]|nr:NAD(P)-dependent oxidoreductase [Telluria sp.]